MINKIYSERFDEYCYQYTHSSGMKILMYPMKDFTEVKASIYVNFGSIDNAYCRKGKEPVSIPDGTAHYLEHKLFESEEQDAFARFAETGAQGNAATSFEYTTYYFTCNKNFEKNLEILLDFVQHPYFTPENVEKERGIITQEILMYQDSPTNRLLVELFAGIFKEYNLNKDIAGTVESIADIDDKLLYDVYDTFYNPTNMSLCISGNIDIDKTTEICNRLLKKVEPIEFTVPEVNEPYEVAKKQVELKMQVAKPLFALGFKRKLCSGEELMLDNLYMSAVMSAAFGSMSEFFMEQRSIGLINDEFDAGIYRTRDCTIPIITAETDDPIQLKELIIKELERLKNDPPSEEIFGRLKKQRYGNEISAFNTVRGVASKLSAAALTNEGVFDFADRLAAMDYQTFCRYLRELDTDNTCLTVVYPL